MAVIKIAGGAVGQKAIPNIHLPERILGVATPGRPGI